MLFTVTDPIANLLGSWSSELSALSILFRIFIILILGSILGLERSQKRHSAGLRTFLLVATSSSAAMIIDQYLGTFFLSAATIIGTAIISSNTTLFTSRSQIKGLTTSVELWTTAFMGLAFGGGLYTLGIIIFATTMIIAGFLSGMEMYLKNRSNHFEIHLELKNASFLKEFVTTARKLGLSIDEMESNPAYIGSGLSVYSVSLSIISDELKQYKTHSEIIEALSSLEYVYHIEEM